MLECDSWDKLFISIMTLFSLADSLLAFCPLVPTLQLSHQRYVPRDHTLWTVWHMPLDKEPQASSDWWIKQITPGPDETTKSPWRKQRREVGRNPGGVIFLLVPIWRGGKKLVWLRFTKRYLKQQVCVWFTSASGHTESLSSGCPLTFSLGHSDDLWTDENRTRVSDLYA